MEELVTVEEAAAFAGVLPRAIYRAISDGRLPFVERYGKKLISRPDLAAYAAHAGERNGYLVKSGKRPPKKEKPL